MPRISSLTRRMRQPAGKADFDSQPHQRIDHVTSHPQYLIGKELHYAINADLPEIPVFAAQPRTLGEVRDNARRTSKRALVLAQGGQEAERLEGLLHVGWALGAYRASLGLSRAKLAHHARLSDNDIAQVEWGLVSVSELAQRVPAYAQGCGVSVQGLLKTLRLWIELDVVKLPSDTSIPAELIKLQAIQVLDRLECVVLDPEEPEKNTQ